MASSLFFQKINAVAEHHFLFLAYHYVSIVSAVLIGKGSSADEDSYGNLL